MLRALIPTHAAPSEIGPAAIVSDTPMIGHPRAGAHLTTSRRTSSGRRTASPDTSVSMIERANTNVPVLSIKVNTRTSHWARNEALISEIGGMGVTTKTTTRYR